MFYILRAIDLLDWNSLINDTTKISSLLMVPNLKVSQEQSINRIIMFLMNTVIWATRQRRLGKDFMSSDMMKITFQILTFRRLM